MTVQGLLDLYRPLRVVRLAQDRRAAPTNRIVGLAVLLSLIARLLARVYVVVVTLESTLW